MAYTHKFSVGGHEGYLHVGLYPDSGQPGEVFVRMDKEGSTLSGLMEAFAICVSVSLQYGVPLEDLCAKFRFMRFEPSGYTSNRDLSQVHSIIDYLFRWMSKTFLDKEGDGADFWQELRRTWHAAHLRMGEDEFIDDLYSHNAMVSTADISPAPALQEPLVSVAHQVQGDAPICTLCGLIMMRNGACYVCTQCGTSSGCG